MVGLPRSKGCTTCRRRKVACDQQRPFCQRCVRAGKQCEGYESYPVFLNRNQDGLVPRTRFEEVKSNLPPDLTCLTGSAYEQNVLSWFCTTQGHHHGSWIALAVELPSPSIVLQKAMLALSLTRYGRLYANNDAVLYGQQRYGEALNLLQGALYDQERAWRDETLVCVRAMILYELFESTSDNAVAWHNHLSGITRLIRLRGPNNHRTPVSQAVLEDVRYALMLKALMLRERSLFGETEWQMGSLSVEQELYDLGFRLAELLEQADQEVYDVHACNDLHDSLEELKTRMEQPAVALNLFACELLLSFVASRLGIEWAGECSDLADFILDIAPSVTDNGEEHRSIFPLTCVLWQYRFDETKHNQAEEMMKTIVEARKVRFVEADYKIESMMPKISRAD